MIVVLASVIALIGVAVVADLRLLRVRPPHSGGDPQRARRMHVDDVYTAWFNANSRCGEALRAWREAKPAARPAAYRAYQLELELEAAAAAELELHTELELHSMPVAA